MAAVVILVFQTEEAGLSPLQLVLVGTAMEATVFFCEVPTGIVADTYSRRLSVLIGFIVSGAGLLISGILPEFSTILLGSIIWGLGFTFISGALHAWISDEIGARDAASVFVRGSQLELLARVIAIPVAVGFALWELNIPILIAGAMLIALALAMAPLMPETGFRRPSGAMRDRVGLAGNFQRSARLVTMSPLLLTVFGIAVFYGAASEGVDRLWTAHVLRVLGLPDDPSHIRLAGWTLGMEPIVWFGIIRMAGTFFSLGASEWARRCLDLTSHRVVSRWLFAINCGQAISLLLFALAGGFWVGVMAFWAATTLSRVYDPLYLGWLNQNVQSSSVRATVLSLSGQADSFGQIAGGPVIGAVGSAVGLRAALVATSAALIPALFLYLRAFRLGPVTTAPESTPITVKVETSPPDEMA